MGGQEAAWGWWRSSSLASLASPAGQVAGARRKPSFPSVGAFSSLQNLASEWCRRAKSGDLEKPFLEKRKWKIKKWGKKDRDVKAGRCFGRVLSLGDLRWPCTCNAFTDCCSAEGGGRQNSALFLPFLFFFSCINCRPRFANQQVATTVLVQG